MGTSTEIQKGEVVLIEFPFSDLSGSKIRPALVINSQNLEVIVCQITSRETIDSQSIYLENQDFNFGSLDLKSNIRPNKLFTASKEIIIYTIGMINPLKIKDVENKIIELVTS